MINKAASLLVALIFAGNSIGQQVGKEETDFTRFIASNTMLFVHYRVAELLQMQPVQSIIASMPGGKVQMTNDIRKDLGLEPEDVDTVTMFIDEFAIVNGEVEPSHPYILMTTKKQIDFVSLRKTAGPKQETTQAGKYELTVGSGQALLRLSDRCALIFLGIQGNNTEAFKRELTQRLAKLESGTTLSGKWKEIVTEATASRSAFCMGFQISDDLRKLGEANLKEAPPMAAPFKALLKCSSGCLTMRYDATQTPDYKFKIALNFPDPQAAQAGLGAVKYGIAAGKMALNNLPKEDAPRNLENFWLFAAGYGRKQIDLIKPMQQEDKVIIDYPMNSKDFLPVLTLSIEKVRTAADKMLSASNMRQLMIAMHNYHVDYQHLPEVMSLKEGKPLHSWRVQILPYLEEEALYRKLRLDEPWNSPHNLKVFESNPMPKIFEIPHKRDGASKKTCYQLFYSQAGAKKLAGFRLGVKTTLGQLSAKDGTSNTIAMAENSKPVLWYKPEDIEFDGAEDFPKISGVWSGNRMQVAFFDGSILTLLLGIDDELCKGLITWDGGETKDVSKVLD